MKVIIEELQGIQSKLMLIESRLGSLLTDSEEDADLLEKTYQLLQEELLEVHKLESIITARKIRILEKKLQRAGENQT